MSEDSPQFDPAADLQAFRQRGHSFLQERLAERDLPEYVQRTLEIDARDLLGLKGHVQETGPWDVIPGSPPDPSEPHYISWNMALTLNSSEFPDCAIFQDDPEELRNATSRILAELGNYPLRPGDDNRGMDRELDLDAAIDPLREAVDCLREPVRTVAINCLYMHDTSREETARVLGLSVETVQFLVDVAFDYLRARLSAPPEGLPRP